jgi:hypothetical protein
MIIENEAAPVKTSGLAAQKFQLEASAKAFSILSSGVYKNPILAVVRELSCNAYDAHVDGKTTDIPFDIHAPSAVEPWFSIRDYGTGIPHDTVLSLYSTYFASTKTGSNDFVGALGIGSKSPFSYASSFTIQSYIDGKCNTYLAFIDENGVPSIASVGGVESDEKPGLEIKFAVLPEDCVKFHNEIKRYFATWASVPPRLIGANLGSLSIDVVSAGAHVGSNWFLAKSSDYVRGAVVIQGNVPYPISGTNVLAHPSVNEKGDRNVLNAIIGRPLVITVPIGTLAFAASREELQYTEKTVEALLDQLRAIAGTIGDKLIDEIIAAPSHWGARKLAYEHKGSFGSLVAGHPRVETEQTKWAGVTLKDLFRTEYIPLSDGVVKSGVVAAHIQVNAGKAIRGIDVRAYNFRVTYPLTIIVNDLPKGMLGRVRHQYLKDDVKYQSTPRVIVISEPQVSGVQKTTMEVAQDFADALGIARSEIILASNISAPPPTVKKGRANPGLVGLRLIDSTTPKISDYGRNDISWTRDAVGVVPAAGDWYVLTRQGYAAILTQPFVGATPEYERLPNGIRPILYAMEQRGVVDSKRVFGIRPSEVKKVPAGVRAFVDVAYEWVKTTLIPEIEAEQNGALVKSILGQRGNSANLLASMIGEKMIPDSVIQKNGDLIFLSAILGTPPATTSVNAKISFDWVDGFLRAYRNQFPGGHATRIEADAVLSKYVAMIDSRQTMKHKIETALEAVGKKHPVVRVLIDGYSSVFVDYSTKIDATTMKKDPCKQICEAIIVDLSK